jgi:hypothetical protein
MRTDKEVLGLTLRQHIGGRWAVSLLMYAVNFPLNVVAILSNAPQTPTLDVLPTWFAIGTLGYLAFGAVLYIANVTVLRNRRVSPVPIAFVVAVGALAGASRGLVVGLLANVTDLAEGGDDPILFRILAGGVLGAVLIPLAALFISIIATYIQRRRQLIEAQHALEITRMRAEGVSDGLRRAFLVNIKDDLAQVAAQQDPDVARDISRKIWESTSTATPAPRLSVRQVLRTSIETNPYLVWPVIMLWSVSAWGAIAPAIGIPRTVGQILYTAVCLWLLYCFARTVTKKYPQHALVVFVFTVITAVALSGPVAYLIFDQRPLNQASNLMVLNAIWLPLFMFLVAIVSGAVRSSEEVIAKLSALVGTEEIQALAAMSEEELIRRDIASKLHGSVQARLLASAALMRQPGLMQQMGINNPASILMEIPELNGSTQRHDERSFKEQLADIVQPWAALMNISINTDSAAIPSSTGADICQVIEEALSNAFRHGRATSVDIAITHDNGELHITIADDGDGLSSERSPGLGSAVLGSLAPGDWTLTPGNDRGAVLHLTLRH